MWKKKVFSIRYVGHLSSRDDLLSRHRARDLCEAACASVVFSSFSFVSLRSLLKYTEEYVCFNDDPLRRVSRRHAWLFSLLRVCLL